MTIGQALDVLMNQPINQTVTMKMRGRMTIGQALEEIGSPEFSCRFAAVSDLDSLIVTSMREPAVNRIMEDIGEISIWQRVYARLQVLVAVPTVTSQTCMEDTAVAIMFWLLRRGPEIEFTKRLRGPIWWWATKMAAKLEGGRR